LLPDVSSATARRRLPSGPVNAPRVGETIFAGAVLILLASGLVPVLIAGGGEYSTDPVSLALQALGCLAATVRLIRSPGGLSRAVERLDPAALALLSLLLLSVAWSVDPLVTCRRVAAVIGATLFGLYLADRWPLEEQVWLVTRTLAVAAVASAAMALFLPGLGLENGAAWSGIFLTKNVLARLMTLGLLAAVVCASRPTWPAVLRGQAFACGLVCLVVLLQASSAFATLVAAAVLVTWVTVFVVSRTVYPLRQALVTLIVVALIGALVLVASSFSLLLDALGRDASLTGRLPLWNSVVQAISERPWFGYGYGAFWHGWEQPSTQVLLENPWGPPNSHNGLLETALDVGVFGVALWLLALLRPLVRGVRTALRSGDGATPWPLALVLLLIAYNVTEVTTMGNLLFWALFVSASSRQVQPAVAARTL